ncbi:MAG: hypothetical protein M3463_14330, partial [Verrucomicrobiota bacterium]|nr:hypothetical protein [Verrucomicrobiota bacterium]
MVCSAPSRVSLRQRPLGKTTVKGKWGEVLPFPNVPIHVHVLPSGKVLFWGRREWNAQNTAPAELLDPHNCTPRIWDPATGDFTVLPKPGFNLFCAGHT